MQLPVLVRAFYTRSLTTYEVEHPSRPGKNREWLVKMEDSLWFICLYSHKRRKLSYHAKNCFSFQGVEGFSKWKLKLWIRIRLWELWEGNAPCHIPGDKGYVIGNEWWRMSECLEEPCGVVRIQLLLAILCIYSNMSGCWLCPWLVHWISRQNILGSTPKDFVDLIGQWKGASPWEVWWGWSLVF